MSLLYSPAATASVAANTNSITVAGMDLGTVLPGMVINLGARDRVTGDGYIIATVAPNGSSGGTLTTVGAIPATYTNTAFVIDTRDFNGTAPNYLISTYTQVLNALLRLTSPLTNLFTGSRQVALDKDSAGAVSRLLYAIGGRTWGGLEQRTVTYTPTGGAQVAAETLTLRAYPDGTTPVDALTIDLSTGGGDLRKTTATMVAATTVDLGSAPVGKVALAGSASIASFGSGRHLERLVHVVDGGATLTHNATSLVLPGGANIITAAGDTLHATSDASGNWRVRSYTRADGTPLLLPASVQPSAQRPSFRNRLVNGDMRINQRGVSPNAAAYPAGSYTVDRWKAGAGGATLSRSSAANGDILVTLTAGTLVQVIEGQLYVPEGGTYVLSWQGSATARVYQGSASGAYASSPLIVTGLSPRADTTVEFTGGSILLPQFEPGTVPTVFERRDDELRRCQRYYEVISGGQGIYQGFSGDGGFFFVYRYVVPKRYSPTLAGIASSVSGFQPGQATLTANSPAYFFTYPQNNEKGFACFIGGFTGIVSYLQFVLNTGDIIVASAE